MAQRPQKIYRLNYHGVDPSMNAAITILGDPAEIRIAANRKSFVAVREEGVTLSGGFPSKINVQGMSDSFKYAGLLQDTPFPLTLIPSTVATPIPRQIFVPPFLETLKSIGDIAQFAALYL